MRFLIAPDSFKESMSALTATAAIKCGVEEIFPNAEFDCIPLSDGGEGFLEVVVNNTPGQIKKCPVQNVFGTEQIVAPIGLIDGGKTAIIEVATVIGLGLIEKEKRNPLLPSSFAVGQLIKFALDTGVEKIILGLGGSGTNDGGLGMARALGVRFLNADGQEVTLAELTTLVRIELSGLDPRLKKVKIIGATDVTNVLLGAYGATAVFAEQKGASATIRQKLEKNLAHLTEVFTEATKRTPEKIPGSGASGGLGYGLLAFCGAELISGGDYVLALTDFAKKVAQCDYVLTGEGAIDAQTAYGKIIIKQAGVAKKYQKPCIVFVGKIGEDTRDLYHLGVTAIFCIQNRALPLSVALKKGPENLTRTAKAVAQILATGTNGKAPEL